MANSHFRSQIFPIFITIIGYFYSFPAIAQEQANVQQITVPPVIDGYVNEAIWETAIPVTDFKRFTPSEGGSPSGKTEVRFLQDQEKQE